jgi:hypothetical protein
MPSNDSANKERCGNITGCFSHQPNNVSSFENESLALIKEAAAKSSFIFLLFHVF